MSEHKLHNDSTSTVSRSFYREGMTDGLPIVPPTDERIEEMLRGTDNPRDYVLGRLGNDDTPITVEQLASNAVMAGCLPTYMPVLEAGVRALADPQSNSIQFSVSTGGWAYQWVLNGPVLRDLGITHGSGPFGRNARVNRATARALGIAYRNTAKIYPGEKDMGVTGNPLKFSLFLAENESGGPWKPYHVTNGFDEEDSTITLAGPNSFIQWKSEPNSPEDVLHGMIKNTPPSMVGGEQQGGDFDQTIFHVLNPKALETLADANLTKQGVKEYISENSYIPIEEFQKGVLWDNALNDYHGKVDSRQVPQISGPEYVKVVAGEYGESQTNVVLGPSIGGPVTKKIQFPSEWDTLATEYAVEE
ncbi:hypothetical protein [Halosolutus gelatinilyticus]|uniref:hypothetical protein n=1 Tax=Halosolutus gelatinilyticus TaxID=2931975 RepID=UPI001FF5CE60|nr:hypothetical protein [Halosolutus gelatinilyticus]